MAVKEFNCNKLKRTFWPFTLKDKVDENGNVVEKGKKIVVRMPQKKVFEAIKEIPNMDEDNATAEDTEAIYRLVAAVFEFSKIIASRMKNKYTSISISWTSYMSIWQ